MKYNLDNEQQINELLNYLEEIRRYSENTIRNYQIDLFQFIRYLYKCNPDLLILEIDKDSVKEFLFSLHAKKLSDKSIARKVATLRAILLSESFLACKENKNSLTLSLSISRINKSGLHLYRYRIN